MSNVIRITEVNPPVFSAIKYDGTNYDEIYEFISKYKFQEGVVYLKHSGYVMLESKEQWENRETKMWIRLMGFRDEETCKDMLYDGDYLLCEDAGLVEILRSNMIYKYKEVE